MHGKILMGVAATLFMLGTGVLLGWADEGYAHSGARMLAHGASGGYAYAYGHEHRETTGQFLRHLLKHRKEIGLTPDQVAKLRKLQLDLIRTRFRTEAEIEVAELELGPLLEDEKADLAAIEAKVKLSEDLEKELRIAAIKTKRDALTLLTPEQRSKAEAEHEKMMKQMGSSSPHRMNNRTSPLVQERRTL